MTRHRRCGDDTHLPEEVTLQPWAGPPHGPSEVYPGGQQPRRVRELRYSGSEVPTSNPCYKEVAHNTYRFTPRKSESKWDRGVAELCVSSETESRHHSMGRFGNRHFAKGV